MHEFCHENDSTDSGHDFYESYMDFFTLTLVTLGKMLKAHKVDCSKHEISVKHAEKLLTEFA